MTDKIYTQDGEEYSRITNIPDKIYLQVGNEPPPLDTEFEDMQKAGDITWNDEPIFDQDIEYKLVKPSNQGVWISSKEDHLPEYGGHYVCMHHGKVMYSLTEKKFFKHYKEVNVDYWTYRNDHLKINHIPTGDVS